MTTSTTRTTEPNGAIMTDINTLAAREGKAIRKSNGFQLERPKAPKKSHLKYGHPPKRSRGKPKVLRVGVAPLAVENELAAMYARFGLS